MDTHTPRPTAEKPSSTERKTPRLRALLGSFAVIAALASYGIYNTLDSNRGLLPQPTPVENVIDDLSIPGATALPTTPEQPSMDSTNLENINFSLVEDDITQILENANSGELSQAGLGAEGLILGEFSYDGMELFDQPSTVCTLNNLSDAQPRLVTSYGKVEVGQDVYEIVLTNNDPAEGECPAWTFLLVDSDILEPQGYQPEIYIAA